MEELLIALLERISNKIPEISLIDEDCGQLEALEDENEDMYPVTFPCVLVGNTDINWTDIAPGVQKGEAQLTVRLAIGCYNDTHIGSGTTDRITERQRLSNKVYKTIQGFRVNRFFGALKRVKSRDYNLPGNIKVYEKVFTFYYHDESAR
jgi:hypothetical protein